MIRAVLFLMLVVSVSCIRNIDPPIRKVDPILVVEGWITTDSTPYQIKLSYSGSFDANFQVGQNQFIPDAQVAIYDNLGDSALCKWQADGTYSTMDSTFVGRVGVSYTLRIRLSNGKIYTSRPEAIVSVSPIDSISAVYDSSFITDVRPTQLIVSVHSHDIAGVQNYYRWTASGYIPRRSSGGPCSLGAPPCGLECVCFAFCAQFLADTRVNVLSDQFIDGRDVIQPVFYSPVYWNGTHYIEIKQHSISRDVYEFWNAYTEQTTRSGSTLDPLPAPLKGNVYNVNDSTDVALGIFAASMTVTKRIELTPHGLQDYYLRSIAGSYIKDGDCQYVFSNTLPDDQGPAGWNNADSVQVK